MSLKMNGYENTLDISPRASVALAIWYTSFGAVFTIFFCVGCLLRGMSLLPTVWLLVFLLPATFFFITAALLAGRIPYLFEKDSSEGTDDAPDNEQAADDASLNNPPPTYKAGQSQSDV